MEMREQINRKRKYNIPVFIPHLGCPNDCAFCNQRKITGRDTEITVEEIRSLISRSIATMEENSEAEVAFFGGSFTGLSIELQKSFLSVANEFFPRINGIRLSTRADYINEEIICILKEYNVTAVELGVQSSDDLVLEKNMRGHSFEAVKKAAGLLKSAGFELGLQMMIGMYGSDIQKDIKTARDIIALKPATTRIYPTVTLKGTHLEGFYNEGLYTPYSLEEAVECAKEVYRLFIESGVTVLRMGLHSSEDLENGAIVAGPYHPAFGELVRGRIYRDNIEKEILKSGVSSGEFEIQAKKNEISLILGQKRCNFNYFKDKYNIELKINIIDI